MADEIKQQAESDRDDGLLQEWAEDQLIERLPVEEWTGKQTEEEIVETICDAVADHAPALISFLETRA
jgi:hypothetical protein